MVKKFLLALALSVGLLSPAYSAGTLPGFSLSQQMGADGKPLAGCKLYIIQAGTTSTPQIAYQDSALTLPVPGGSQLTCDAAGRIAQFFLADGSIKIRLADVNGVTQLTADGLLVVGPSGGGGGGSTVDATTILATGDLKVKYGTGILSGFVRANGRTIGSATSGATERANADCQSLFEYLWGADANLTVSTGRGASANADWVANKTIAVPDWRGRALAGLDDMGNTAAGILTSTYFGSTATVLGAIGGSQSITLSQGNLPAVTLPITGNVTVTSVNQLLTANQQPSAFTLVNGAGSNLVAFPSGTAAVIASQNSTGTVTSGNTGNMGSNVPHTLISPTKLATIYLKL